MAWNRPDDSKQKPRWSLSPSVMRATGVAVVVLSAVACAVLIGQGVTARATDEVREEEKARKLIRNRGKKRLAPVEAVRAVMPAELSRRERARRNAGRAPKDMFAYLEGLDKKQAEKLQAALDNEDFKRTMAAAKEALTSENPEVRSLAVDAMGWFGAEALPELTGCMADPDEDIREQAEGLWEVALDGVPASDDKYQIAMAAFGALDNADQLSSLGSVMSAAAVDLIDGAADPETSAQYRLEIVQSLVDIIEGEGYGDANIAAAAEAYEEITGHEWISFEEAGRYLENPEDYDPDERPVAEGKSRQQTGEVEGEMSGADDAEQKSDQTEEDSDDQQTEPKQKQEEEDDE